MSTVAQVISLLKDFLSYKDIDKKCKFTVDLGFIAISKICYIEIKENEIEFSTDDSLIVSIKNRSITKVGHSSKSVTIELINKTEIMIERVE